MACLQTRVVGSESQETWLTVVEVSGVEERRLALINDGFPIYVQWSPDSAHLALLTQEESHLVLGLCSVQKLGAYRVVEEGAPLFFSWAGDSRRLLIHSGSGGETRLIVRDVMGGDPDEFFSKQPGNFCTPLVTRNNTIFVGREKEHGVLCMSDIRGSDAQALASIEGLVSMAVSPDDSVLAFSSAPPGARQLYQGIWLVDLGTGAVQHLVNEGVVAYFWKPDGSGLVFVTRGRGPAEFLWNQVAIVDGSVHRLAGFFPTFAQKFQMHFFEQFAVSHSAVSADSSRLVYASHPNPRAGGSDTTPHIFSLDLHATEAKPELIAPGEFAICSPESLPV